MTVPDKVYVSSLWALAADIPRAKVTAAAISTPIKIAKYDLLPSSRVTPPLARGIWLTKSSRLPII